MNNSKEKDYYSKSLKRLLIFCIVVVLAISLSACSEGENTSSVSDIEIETQTTANTEEASEPTEPVKVEGIEKSSSITTLKKISRNASGLDSINRLDFDGFTINGRINELMKDWSLYKDEDYKNGIVQGNGSLIVSERFAEDIIGGIKVGTDIETVRSILGAPSFSFKDFLFYKTRQYYFGIKGKVKVEQAIFGNNPKDYNLQILDAILKELNKPDYSFLEDSLDQNDTISSFFDSNGHINGGGWYANSDNGITVEEFSDDDNVTIYNNFEGELFKYEGQEGKFKIIYVNEDYMVQQLSWSLDDYASINERFDTEGVLSPGGKYKCLYDWIYSMSQYFTVRTMDKSKPDLRLPATSQDYRWLSDKYILYIHAFYCVPYIINVEDDSQEHINALYNLGIIKDKYYDNIGDFEFIIEDVKDDSIILRDEKSKKVYTIKYSFDTDGSINLDLLD